MKLKVLLPTEILVDQEVTKVIAEAENGSFCLLPRHIDFVAALPPGILIFESAEGHEEFIAVDEGTLVKVGREVLVSTRNAVRSSELGTLKQIVEQEFRVLDDREKMAHSASAKLEADLVRRFIELGEYERHG
ncbi:MAG: F0F1 ATP synthase subunit epsilon [Thermodesulfobacteriota bacterium]|jgi:F-type H+-transporting ATPase subunit epsilon